MRRMLPIAVAAVLAAVAVYLSLTRPPDLAPAPAPEPCPCPDPAPCPGPGPCPKPCPCPKGTSWGAAVSGPTSPDGTEADCDFPTDQHLRNTGGSDGAGLCVFCSAAHASRWHNIGVLDDYRDWMRKYPGGGYPDKFDSMTQKLCNERSKPVPSYFHLEGDDIDTLVIACRTGRMPCVTYSVSPTGRYGRQRISHMVNLVHADGDRFAILDNNYPGSYEWMNRAEFERTFCPGGQGWAIVFTCPGPPPPPRTFVEEGSSPGRSSQAAARAAQIETEWEWKRCLNSEDLALYRDGALEGFWHPTDGAFFAQRGEDAGRPGPAPFPPPALSNAIDRAKISRTPRYTMSGQVVDRERVRAALIGNGKVPDDSKKPWVVVVGPEADRSAVAKDWAGSPALAEARQEYRFQAYAPDHWAARGVGLAVKGKPSIFVLSATGEVIHYQADYDGGAEALAQLLRKPAPNNDPDKYPDLRRGGGSSIISAAMWRWLQSIPWAVWALAVALIVALTLPKGGSSS